MSANLCTVGLEFFTKDGVFIEGPAFITKVSSITFKLPCDWNDIMLHIISKLRHGFQLDKLRFNGEYKSNSSVVTPCEIQKMVDFKHCIGVFITQTDEILSRYLKQKIFVVDGTFRASAGIIEEIEPPAITDDGFSLHVARSPSRLYTQSNLLSNQHIEQSAFVVDWAT